MLGAALLSLYWVFLVPIFEAPDEPAHLDYAFSIFTTGHLLSGRVTGVSGSIHPYTAYLIQASHLADVQFQPSVPVPPRYGSASFYAAVDRAAPHIQGAPHYLPVLLSVYPCGYYALVALWMGIIHLFTPSLVALFFGARILSVILLICSLMLSYGILRELRVHRWMSLVLVAVLGFFPLTSFVSSYIQPDNLSLTAVSLCLYLALRARHRPRDARLLAGLGVALGVLLITKYQLYACVLIPILAVFLTQRLGPRMHHPGWVRMIVLLLPPSLLFGAVQLWVVWRTHAPYSAAIGSRAVAGQVNYAAAHQAISHGPGPFAHFVLTGLFNAVQDYWLNGPSFHSFLGYFGWMDTPLIIGSPAMEISIQHLATGLVVAIAFLTVVRMFQIGWRLLRLVRRHRYRRAMRLACYNPVINSFFLFVAFMLVLYVMTSNTFGAQGRNWFPYLLPILVISVIYAPGAVPVRLIRVLVSRVILACLLLYTVFGSYYAVQTVRQRFYGSTFHLSFRLPASNTAHKVSFPTLTEQGSVVGKTRSSTMEW